ncbi:sugar ABC transporter permease [Tengunoibacter tsumagoiensis]|uniref:ABC transporter permease n=1 Tax=Tengunoibacter tsumagoiensis TaxID=2014871 RepID=A0A402A650_9CHLR|nr:carbohydrate ABC transporter permease [Tengunoibacter tsumagoiensis]GCE14608.1 ABC transporter permease [Tengunoibacter tsumagoiensis]
MKMSVASRSVGGYERYSDQQRQVKRQYRSRAVKTRLQALGIHGLLIFASLIALFPLFIIIMTSFKPAEEIFTTKIQVFPIHWTIDNYTYVLNDGFFSYMKNSVIVCLGTTCISLLAALPAAFALSRYEFRGKLGLLMSFLVTQMFPAPLLIVPLYALFIQIHLLNNLFGLIIAGATGALPFSVWMLKAFFDAVPQELDQAGLLDGLGPFGVFYYIALPLTLPGIAVVWFLNFISSWNEFFFANLFISDKDIETLPLGLTHYVFQTGQHWQWLCAYAVLVTIPVVVVFYWAQRYLVAGLTSGSMKG